MSDAKRSEPVLTRHADGRVTISCFPQEIMLADALLEVGDERLIWRDGEQVRFRLANGSATYEVVEHVESVGYGKQLRCRRLKAEIGQP